MTYTNLTKHNTTNNKENEKKTINLNPVDTLIRINASAIVRQRILSIPEYCLAYVDCMELVPGAKALIASLRAQEKKVNIILETPYQEEVVSIIAHKFHIPYQEIRRGTPKQQDGPSLLAEIVRNN